MGNGNYLIAYTVREDNQGSAKATDVYYRIFDTELGSFAGGSEYLGSVYSVDFLTLSQEEAGRVLIQDGMSNFSAEVMDDGNGILTDRSCYASFDLGLAQTRNMKML